MTCQRPLESDEFGSEGRKGTVGEPVDGEVLRRLIREAGGGVRVRDLAGRTGMATAVSGGLAVVNYPDGEPVCG